VIPLGAIRLLLGAMLDVGILYTTGEPARRGGGDPLAVWRFRSSNRPQSALLLRSTPFPGNHSGARIRLNHVTVPYV
jgi:hypothetical protein